MKTQSLNGGARRGNISGATVTIIVCFLALVGIVSAFLKNSSPYVTIAQARQNGGTGLHLEGDIIQSSIASHPSAHSMTFDVRDANGDVITVDYTGAVPENFGEVHKLVAIGQMKGKSFASDKLLVKCPSKYEAKPKG